MLHRTVRLDRVVLNDIVLSVSHDRTRLMLGNHSAPLFLFVCVFMDKDNQTSMFSPSYAHTTKPYLTSSMLFKTPDYAEIFASIVDISV